VLWQGFELARQLESQSVPVKHLFAISSDLFGWQGLTRSCVSTAPRVSVLMFYEMIRDKPWAHWWDPRRLPSRWREAELTRQDVRRLARYTPAPGDIHIATAGILTP
jgi:hypothetical protein